MPEIDRTGGLADYESQAIIRRAAELQAAAVDRTSLDDLKRMAEEVGIEPEFVELALAEMRNRNPRAFTTTVIRPLPFAPSAGGRPLDPIERHETLEEIALANHQEPGFKPDRTTRLAQRGASEFDRRFARGFSRFELDLSAGWLIQQVPLHGPVALTGSSLTATLALGFFHPRFHLVSRAGRSRVSVRFSRRSAVPLVGLLIAVAIAALAWLVLDQSLVGACLSLVAFVLTLAATLAAGDRARNRARRLLYDFEEFVATLSADSKPEVAE